MRNRNNLKYKIAEGGMALIIFILFVAILLGISWICTCGVIKLITICFGITFKWRTATGIWLLLFIIRSAFSVTVKDK